MQYAQVSLNFLRKDAKLQYCISAGMTGAPNCGSICENYCNLYEYLCLGNTESPIGGKTKCLNSCASHDPGFFNCDSSFGNSLFLTYFI